MSTTLPERPNLDWYRKAAKKLLQTLRANSAEAKLADAQLTIARNTGFDSWKKLKAQIESAAPPVNPAVAIDAIQSRDLKKLKRWLNASPALANARNEHGQPLLSIAVEEHAPAIVQLLLDAGADPTARYGRSAHTPLSWAMTVGSFEAAQVLLKAGVKPDLFCAAGLNAIDALAHFFDADGYAIPGSSQTGSSRYDAGKLLLAPPSDRMELASDALYIAARNGHAQAVRFLLSKKVDLEFRGYMGGTPLHWAYFSSSREVIQLLLKAGADAEARDHVMHATPRAFAVCVPASWGIMAALQRRLAADPGAVNLLDGRGTALHEAARAGQLASAKALLEAGADPSIRDADGKTPLDLVDAGKHADLAALFARSKPTKKEWSVENLPEKRKSHKIAQWKPIMDAAFRGDAAKIVKLIAAGADPNVVSTTPAKYRPLHRAIEFKKTEPRLPKHVDAVKALLANGADPTLRGTRDQCSALILATFGSPQFIPVLVDRFRPFDLFHACALGDDQRVAALLKKDKSLATKRDTNEWTPLHYAAASELHEGDPAKSAALVRIAKMLLESGADLMAAWNYDGEWPLRPLYYAAGRSNHPAMVDLLLRAGADPCDNESVYHASDEGHTASLDLIEKYTDAKKLAAECTTCLRTQFHWGHSAAAKWLLEHGADPNSLYPRSGNSALHAAAKAGASEKVIALLLEHGGDPSVRNAAGKTAIQLAKAVGKTRVVKQLQKA